MNAEAESLDKSSANHEEEKVSRSRATDSANFNDINVMSSVGFSCVSDDLLKQEDYLRSLDSEISSTVRLHLTDTESAMKNTINLWDTAILDDTNLDTHAVVDSVQKLESSAQHSKDDTCPSLDVRRPTSSASSKRASSARGTKIIQAQSESKVARPKGKVCVGIGPLDAGLIAKVAAKLDSFDFSDKCATDKNFDHDNTLEATNIYLKARLMVVEEELLNSAKELTVLREESKKEKSASKSLLETVQAKTKSNAALQAAASRDAEKVASLTKKLCEANECIHGLQKALEKTQRAETAVVSAVSHKVAKLSKALEENQRLRQLHTQSEQTRRDEVDQLRKAVDKLKLEIKRIERQKLDLLAGFKKQGQLVEVLRKQKLHLEAATMLGFTEEEFKSLTSLK